jgi:hypothetical protein
MFHGARNTFSTMPVKHRRREGIVPGILNLSTGTRGKASFNPGRFYPG